MQNELRMAKEKARRKQAIIGRQEEELAAREASLDSMRKEQAGSSRQVDHLQEDNKALKVHLLPKELKREKATPFGVNLCYIILCYIQSVYKYTVSV